MWDEVPADQQNGVITGYAVTYHPQIENGTGSVITGPNDRQMNLTSVQEYVNNNITVFASTAKGDVFANDPVDPGARALTMSPPCLHHNRSYTYTDDIHYFCLFKIDSLLGRPRIIF